MRSWTQTPWTGQTIRSWPFYVIPSPSTWSADPSLRPDPVFFKDVLRENLVNGKVLLNHVGKMLQKDLDTEILGLRAFGHRSMVLDVIQDLRQRSVNGQIPDGQLDHKE
ncbi:hypothetical protein V8E54_000113 [Elaphomyces granulatus]